MPWPAHRPLRRVGPHPRHGPYAPGWPDIVAAKWLGPTIPGPRIGSPCFRRPRARAAIHSRCRRPFRRTKRHRDSRRPLSVLRKPIPRVRDGRAGDRRAGPGGGCAFRRMPPVPLPGGPGWALSAQASGAGRALSGAIGAFCRFPTPGGRASGAQAPGRPALSCQIVGAGRPLRPGRSATRRCPGRSSRRHGPGAGPATGPRPPGRRARREPRAGCAPCGDLRRTGS